MPRLSKFKKNLWNDVLLALQLGKNSISRKYGSSFFGLFWYLLQPLIQIMVYVCIFRNVVLHGVKNYSFFVSINYLTWLLINSSISSASSTILHSGSLLKRYNINKFVFHMANLLENFVLYIFSLSLCLVFFWIKGAVSLSPLAILLLPFYLFILFVTVLFAGTIIAYIGTFCTDVNFAVSLISPLSVWITPIFYSIETISNTKRLLQSYLNPFYILIRPISEILCFNIIPNWHANVALLSLFSIVILTYFIVFKIYDKKIIYYTQ